MAHLNSSYTVVTQVLTLPKKLHPVSTKTTNSTPMNKKWVSAQLSSRLWIPQAQLDLVCGYKKYQFMNQAGTTQTQGPHRKGEMKQNKSGPK